MMARYGIEAGAYLRRQNLSEALQVSPEPGIGRTAAVESAAIGPAAGPAGAGQRRATLTLEQNMKSWIVCAVLAACCAASPAHAVPYMRIKLPTAADGDITYLVAMGSKKPARVGDDRAEVVAVGFMLVPGEAGQHPRWTVQYSLRFKDGVPPASIAVWIENPGKGHIDVRDDAPVLHDGLYTTMSPPKPMDEDSFTYMQNDRMWMAQSKFVIRYADGVERTLHQLSVLSHAERMALLNTVTAPEPAHP